MTITANTRISKIIKYNELALDAIISISPVFQKLKNPLLRKIMAPRTSIYMAAMIGNCTPEAFFERLAPLGFKATETSNAATNISSEVPLLNIVNTLDVRDTIREGGDPLTSIIKAVNNLKTGEGVIIINSFVPLPLIKVLQKKGYSAYVEKRTPEIVYTTFSKGKAATIISKESTALSTDWEAILKASDSNIQYIDVRQLQMPQPMMQILEALQHLEAGHVLYVYHNRIPVYLLSELKSLDWQYRIRTIKENEVHLMIFRNDKISK